jgi:hypothetical protein
MQATNDCTIYVSRRWGDRKPRTFPPENSIILDLDRVAINSRTLFPDLDGLARGLWETEILRKAFGRE